MRQSESSEALRFVDTDDMLFCVEMETDGLGTFGCRLLGLSLNFVFPDQEKKKWRPQQEGTWPRHLYALLELLSLRWKGQGHQALHSEEHG
jgi:hypothetical protein